MKWQARTTIQRPDNKLKGKRTIEFEAPDRETAEAMVAQEVRKGGYSGYELLKVLELEPVS